MTAEKLYYFIQINAFDDLQHVLTEKSRDEVKLMLENIVNTVVWTKENYMRDGISCLHYVAKKGRATILKEMLQHEGVGKQRLDIEVASSLLAWRPLHYAAYAGHVPIIKLLHGRLATIDARAKDNKTPLHLSVQQGMRYAVASLVNKGANVNLQDDSGMTALHYAVDKSSIVLSECTARHTREVVDFLIKKGADACISNTDGDTALHCALKAQLDTPIIKLLSNEMKKKNALDKDNRLGLSPMHLCKTQECFQILLSAGVSVNKPTTDGRSLAHIHSNDYETACYLISKNADISATDKQGRIPLHSAVIQLPPCLETVKLYGGEYKHINATDKAGATALHLACTNGYKHVTVKDSEGLLQEQTVDKASDPILEYLIEHGADLDAQNTSGQTPLHLALRHKLFDKATVLISHGASLDIADARNITPHKINPTWATKCMTSRKERSSSIAFHSARPSAKPKKHPLPKWVTTGNIETGFCDGNNTSEQISLSRELTSLHNDVKDVKHFLEQFSSEGG